MKPNATPLCDESPLSSMPTHDFQLFTGREDPGGRDEQYERLFIVSLDASSAHARFEAYAVGEPEVPVPMRHVLDQLVSLVAIRNPDFYEYKDGKLVSVPG